MADLSFSIMKLAVIELVIESVAFLSIYSSFSSVYLVFFSY